MNHDVLVVGASIAGLYTGWKCAESGMRVLIVDRRNEIGVPVRCGEATGNRCELSRFFPVDESWIARDLTGLAVHVNDELSISRAIDNTGVILHRDRFEQFLYARAAAAGATIILGRTVTALTGSPGAGQGVHLDSGEKLTATLLIGADGPESRIGRWSGITNVLAPKEAFPSLQYRIDTEDQTEGMLHFYIGARAIPRGYLWVFPRGDSSLSIGAGMFGIGRASSEAAQALERFLGHYYPGARRSHLISGCAPLAVCPRRLHAGNVAVVGDAARQVNPLTAGGIMNTLEAADLLCRSIALAGGDPARSYEQYTRTWSGRARMEQKAFLVLQRLFLDCSDRDLVRILSVLKAVFAGSIDRSQPFRFPLLKVLRSLAVVAPKSIKHLHILFT